MNTVYFNMNFSSNELAAWIQAIGSIIAVFIAMWIPYKTNKSLILDQKLKIELRRKNTLLLGRVEHYNLSQI